MEKKKIRFIINPKSGTGAKDDLVIRIDHYIDKSIFTPEVAYTKAAGHATELAAEAVEKKYDVVVAVGGDGSVNETATALVHTDTALAIVPMGSGNGMARHLKIPVDVAKSLRLINKGKIETIDTIKANERFCIGTIGVGFDAYIAHLFSNAKKRGYSTYVKLVLAEFSSYKVKHFSILADGKQIEKDCFLLTFANSSQFGNNAVIAPFADVKDGRIEISMLKRFPVFSAPALIYKLMNDSIHTSRYFEGESAANIILKNQIDLQGHIDGEPVIFSGDLTIKTDPLSLKVIVPPL
jgi:diacylglycerol kinase (ATP)